MLAITSEFLVVSLGSLFPNFFFLLSNINISFKTIEAYFWFTKFFIGGISMYKFTDFVILQLKFKSLRDS